jgi:hypothetical protein
MASMIPMKFIPVILVLILPLWLSAQDCNLKKSLDPYTRETKLSTGLISLKGTSLSIDADSHDIDFFFSMEGKEKCFNDASTVIVIFEGSKAKTTYKNNGTMNCDGVFHVIFKNQATTPTLLQRLTAQKIVSLTFTDSNKGQIVVPLSPEEQQKIMTLGSCLITEAKALVK